MREFTRQSARTKEPAAHLKNIKPRHRDHYNTATSAIFIVDFRAGCELWVFTTTKAEITAFFFFFPLFAASEEPELFWDLSVLH